MVVFFGIRAINKPDFVIYKYISAIIYLDDQLLNRSSGKRASSEQGIIALLAASRVCLYLMSPLNTASSYLALFTLT